MQYSGRKLFLKVLNKYSSQLTNEVESDCVTRDIQGALLKHISSAEMTVRAVKKLSWMTEKDDDDSETTNDDDLEYEPFIRQGLSVNNAFLSDIIDYLQGESIVFDCIRKYFPELSDEECDAALTAIWGILRVFEMNSQTLELETLDSDTDYDEVLQIAARTRDILFAEVESFDMEKVINQLDMEG